MIELHVNGQLIMLDVINIINIDNIDYYKKIL